MADNYLERRMEDFRRGSFISRSESSPTKRKGMYFPFPPKRVLIATMDSQRSTLAHSFLKTGCSVAMFSDRNSLFEKEWQDTSFRNYSISFSSQEEVATAFENLIRAWRDIDIIVADAAIAETLLNLWETHRSQFPYTSDYVSRIIVFGEEGRYLPENTPLKFPVTLNCIRRVAPETDLTDLILMLTLPKNHIINGITFEI